MKAYPSSQQTSPFDDQLVGKEEDAAVVVERRRKEKLLLIQRWKKLLRLQQQQQQLFWPDRLLPELGFEPWQLDLDGKVGEKQRDDQMLLKEHQDGELLVSRAGFPVWLSTRPHQCWWLG